MNHWVLMVFTSLVLFDQSVSIDNSAIIAASRQTRTNRSCYSCSSVDDYTCLNLSLASKPPTKTCNESERDCAVTRIEYENSDHTNKVFWALERICMHDCIPGCITLGERTRLRHCTACCSDDLCNTSSFAPSSNSVYPFLLFPSILLIVFYHVLKL